MKPRLLDYTYIALTILFTVYGQLMMKWRIGHYGSFPETPADKLRFLVRVLLDPGVVSAFAAAFLGSLAWMAAMTKFDLSHAYPFMSLNLVVVVLLSMWLFAEPLTLQKIVGVGLIVLGTLVISRE